MEGVNFDSVARYYDTISFVVFGRALRKSQTYFLNEIPNATDILIVGGGTGWILKEILDRNPSCRICYVETSARMLELSAKKMKGYAGAKVEFLHGDANLLSAQCKFDCVITNYFLDLFPADQVSGVTSMLMSFLKPAGVWLAADFTNQGNAFQKILLRLMYRFFQLFTGIEAKGLPEWEKEIVNCGARAYRSTYFLGKFVKSVMFVKN